MITFNTKLWDSRAHQHLYNKCVPRRHDMRPSLLDLLKRCAVDATLGQWCVKTTRAWCNALPLRMLSPDYLKKNIFSLLIAWNVQGGRRSYWPWFYVNRYIFAKTWAKKRISYFCPQWPWTLRPFDLKKLLCQLLIMWLTSAPRFSVFELTVGTGETDHV